jgi:hypothetical protein
MIEVVKRLFARTKKPRVSDRRLQPVLEEFERRNLPSAGMVCAAAHHQSMGEQATVRTADAGVSGNADNRSEQCQSNAKAQTLSATLSGATGTSGSVTFTSNSATSDNSLKVEVSGLSANSTYTVTSGTTTLGSITTDANGDGKLAVSNLSPALEVGAAISVTDSQNATVLFGTLADTTDQTTSRIQSGSCN